MLNVIVGLSKYFIIILITLYTLFSFTVFRSSNKKKKNRIFYYQRIIILLFQMITYLLLFLEEKSIKYLLFYLLQVIFFFVILIIYQKAYKSLSKLVLNHLLFLLNIGFVMQIRLDFTQGMKHFFMAAAGLLLCIVVPFVIERFRYLAKFGWFYAMAGIGLLALVYLFGVEIYGAKNWIRVFGIYLQPSEFVKILFVLFAASLLSNCKSFGKIVVVSIVAAMHVGILVLEKDLGGALIFFVTYLSLLFVATGNGWYLAAGGVAGGGAAVVAYRLFAHVRVRVSAWRNPWADIDNTGYQVTQSLFAIGTGGWFGMGLGRGLPTSIPVVESDFVFAAISEELGGIFCICLLLIYVSCFLMCINIAMQMHYRFYKLTALGLSIIFMFQVFLSIGGVVKLIPSTGVTLPLLSSGGSSILSTLILFGIIQGLYVLNQTEVKRLSKVSLEE